MANRYTVDEVDKINHPDCKPPEQYHYIICKQCSKKRRELKRYTRICTKCRTGRKYRVNSSCALWDTWGD